MRLPTVLSSLDLPEQELITATMDGELYRVGAAYSPVDSVPGPQQRAMSIASVAPRRAIAEQHTAAWVYGATLTVPFPLQLCVDARTKVHPLSTPIATYREVVISDEELIVVSGLGVTSPLRTALDIARFSSNFSEQDAAITRSLADFGGFDLELCRTALGRRRNLPNKRVALERLTRTLN